MSGIDVIAENHFGPPPEAPTGRPLMTQTWEAVSFLHWPYEPDVVQEVLPAGLTVDTHDGRGWVGLVPFRMRDIAPAGLPSVPYLGTFPETNIRTYVLGPDGSPGVWFSSLEASRLLPVLTARLAYRLPYYFAAMHVAQDSPQITYTSFRRWPGPRAVGGRIRVEPYLNSQRDTSALADFLTSRWRLFTGSGGGIRSAEVRHEPWRLYPAAAHEYSKQLLEAAGYPRPSSEPHVMFSPGVEVTAYPPMRA